MATMSYVKAMVRGDEGDTTAGHYQQLFANRLGLYGDDRKIIGAHDETTAAV
jgi:hypothetical protein